MKEYTIQYLDENGNIQIAYVKARSKEETADKFRNGGAR